MAHIWSLYFQGVFLDLSLWTASQKFQHGFNLSWLLLLFGRIPYLSCANMILRVPFWLSLVVPVFVKFPRGECLCVPFSARWGDVKGACRSGWSPVSQGMRRTSVRLLATGCVSRPFFGHPPAWLVFVFGVPLSHKNGSRPPWSQNGPQSPDRSAGKGKKLAPQVQKLETRARVERANRRRGSSLLYWLLLFAAVLAAILIFVVVHKARRDATRREVPWKC